MQERPRRLAHGRQPELRSDAVFLVKRQREVEEAVRDAGIEADSSCEEGTCGTCETRVLAGVPEHRDVVLSDADRGSNGYMMICVSRALSAELVLDL